MGMGMMRQEDISTPALLCKLAQLTPEEKQALLRHIDAMLPGGTEWCPNWTPPIACVKNGQFAIDKYTLIVYNSGRKGNTNETKGDYHI